MLVPPLKTTIVVFKCKNSANVYSDKSFVSTSLDYEGSKLFSGKNCCVLQITVSAGSKVLPIKDLSRYQEEEEVLLDRDSIFFVTGSMINETDNMKIIFVTYNPKNSIKVENKDDISNAEDEYDSDLIVERIIDNLKDDDPDYIDDETIIDMYKTITGKMIEEHRLGI